MKSMIAVWTVVLTLGAQAFTVSRIYTDDMTLQRDKPIKVTGSGAPGETVEVTFDGETVKERQAKQGGIAGDGGLFGDYFYKGRSHGTEDGYSGPDGGKPFDSLGYAKKQTRKKFSNEGLEAGDKVRHPKFGEGMLIEDSGKILAIAFDSVGIKKIGKGFVNIEKVD